MRLNLFMVHNKFKNILVIGFCIVFPSLGSEAVQECS